MLSFSEFARLKDLLAHATFNSLGVERKDMPQITHDKLHKFQDYIWGNHIPWVEQSLDPNILKPIQKDFDIMKIRDMIVSNTSGTIFVSKDGYVLDGHHRWLAAKFSGAPVMCRVLQSDLTTSLTHIEDSGVY